VITRRGFLGGTLALAACGTDKPGTRVASDAAKLPQQLRELETALRTRGFPVDQGLRAAVTVDGVPEELRALWAWHDGQPDGAFPLFRDMLLLRSEELDDARESVKLLASDTGVALVPFAGFDGQYYVVPETPWAFDRRFERPVLSVGEGTSVYFHSLGHLVDTQRAWIEAGVHRPGESRVDATRELDIWRRINPGLF
jgi:hypothetical protein